MAKWIAIAVVLILALVFIAMRWSESGRGGAGLQSDTPAADSAGQSSNASLSTPDDGAAADIAASQSRQVYEYDSLGGQSGPAGGAQEPPRTTVGIIETMKSESMPVTDPDYRPPEASSGAPGSAVAPSRSSDPGSTMAGPPPQGYVVDTSGPPPVLSDEVLPGPAVGIREPVTEPGDVIDDGSDMISPPLPGPGPGSGAVDPPGLGPGESPDDNQN